MIRAVYYAYGWTYLIGDDGEVAKLTEPGNHVARFIGRIGEKLW